jgi:hypothetical protein
MRNLVEGESLRMVRSVGALARELEQAWGGLPAIWRIAYLILKPEAMQFARATEAPALQSLLRRSIQ